MSRRNISGNVLSVPSSTLIPRRTIFPAVPAARVLIKEGAVLKVGILRNLLYYNYFPLWKTFFEELGIEVVVSSPTNKRILESGVKKAVDDACLPVKLTFGHALDLAGRVDYLFIPRLVSIESDAFTCPKLIGLPDMIRANLNELPPLLDTCFDLKKGRSFYRSFRELGRNFTRKSYLIKNAFQKAEIRQREFEKTMERGLTPGEALKVLEGSVPPAPNNFHRSPAKGLRIALIGHPYNLYDGYMNMGLIAKLRQGGCQVITAEMLPAEVLEKASSAWREDIFWTLSRRMMGAASHFFNSNGVDGIISCISFECGPNSLLQVLIEEEAKKHRETPYMSLILDEHTGEAGIITRIEAFLDMVRRKEPRGRRERKKEMSEHQNVIVKIITAT